MGAQSSNAGGKCQQPQSLAEKRYRVDERTMRRRSTRKMGNVTTTGCDMPPILLSSSLLSAEPPIRGGDDTSNNEAIIRNGVDQRLFALYPQQIPSSAGRTANRAGENAANSILLTRTQRVLIETSWKKSRRVGFAQIACQNPKQFILACLFYICRATTAISFEIGSESVGARIFISVLTTQPDIKLLFGLEKVPQGRLKYDPGVRRHASLLTKTFEYIVKNLVYTEKLTEHFNELGRRHCQLESRGLFKEAHWDAFSECITQAVIENESVHRCRETAIAWRTLIAFIIKQMRRGFDEERTLRKRFSASLIGLSASRQSMLTTTTPPITDAGINRNRPKTRTGIPEGSFHRRRTEEFQQRGDSRISLPITSNENKSSTHTWKLPISPKKINCKIDGGPGHQTLSPLDTNFVKQPPSSRSASWCSPQVDFVEDLGRRLEKENSLSASHSSCDASSHHSDEFYTPPSSSTRRYSSLNNVHQNRHTAVHHPSSTVTAATAANAGGGTQSEKCISLRVREAALRQRLLPSPTIVVHGIGEVVDANDADNCYDVNDANSNDPDFDVIDRIRRGGATPTLETTKLSHSINYKRSASYAAVDEYHHRHNLIRKRDAFTDIFQQRDALLEGTTKTHLPTTPLSRYSFSTTIPSDNNMSIESRLSPPYMIGEGGLSLDPIEQTSRRLSAL